ncbi:50S ribosomal protein L10, chloroplastic [Argentina anserina]|uniref:50S ribosomal protein L10, chloroplastic n=1 Tax=Argentina anserina TaxID=57926 RepID=UPI00217634A2|nr:50S ribosomal protein L10, chloroplastic [Potentilla anserina]XP_050364759.1 50S ribosomal protein L10, chloroplastic [Potentilla anserina]XP_050364760.1 50S ribosomal protein L10, chloroplastic [Potentilla anserina]XP_050364761.1 50S ribosomal protein L10, chloroplastic [Potentilla anserina]
MEATLFSSPPPHSPLSLTRPANPFLTLPTRPAFPTRRSSSTIRSAISRTKKEETVSTIKTNLENCYLLAGISFKGLSVKQLQDLRKALPDSTKLIVAKNTLVIKAIEGTPWEALKPCMTGMNAWLFVHSEEIPPAIKPYREFQRERKLENDFTGAVFEGKFYGPGEFKALETMPTRLEIYAKLLGSLKGPASSVVGTIQAPARELVMTLQAYVQKLEQEGGQ